jgi:tRNA-binding EMAP/Myf-like protein
LEVSNHPERDHLFIEKIDLGESSGPRTIVSGLAKFITKEEFTGKTVVVAANLKPAKFAGVMSQGMILAASNEDKSIVELLEPPANAKAGEPIVFEGFESAPDPVLNPKHKIFEKCAADFTTTDDLTAVFQGVSFKSTAGDVKVKSLKNATIS